MVDRRVVFICASPCSSPGSPGWSPRRSRGLIGLVTNLAFYGRMSTVFALASANRLGPLAILVPSPAR